LVTITPNSGMSLLTSNPTIASHTALDSSLHVTRPFFDGALDVTNGALLVRYPDTASALAAYQTTLRYAAWQAQDGYKMDWAGQGGITSSTATADTNLAHAVAVVVNFDPQDPTTAIVKDYGDLHWYGPGDARNTLFPSDVLIRYTYSCDFNLDGKLTSTDWDYLAYGWGFQTDPNEALWANGDSNYDGKLTSTDWDNLAYAWGLVGTGTGAPVLGVLPGSDSVGAAPPLAPAVAPASSGGGPVTVVPEPGTVCLVLAGGLLVLGGRRNRKQA
jgi:hypothetical protein